MWLSRKKVLVVPNGTDTTFVSVLPGTGVHVIGGVRLPVESSSAPMRLACQLMIRFAPETTLVSTPRSGGVRLKLLNTGSVVRPAVLGAVTARPTRMVSGNPSAVVSSAVIGVQSWPFEPQ